MLTLSEGLTLLGVLVASATIILVWRQVKIMNRQTTMMEEQGAIVRAQHGILEKQLALSVKVEVALVAEETQPDVHIYRLAVFNKGTKVLRPFRWAVLIPLHQKDFVEINADGFSISADRTQITVENPRNGTSPQQMIRIRGFKDEPIFPYEDGSCARVRVKLRTAADQAGSVTLLWQLFTEDDFFSSTTLGPLLVKR